MSLGTDSHRVQTFESRLSKILLFFALLILCMAGTLLPLHLFAEHHFYLGMGAIWVAFSLLGPVPALGMALLSAVVSIWFFVVAPGFTSLHWLAVGPPHVAVLMVAEVAVVSLLQRFAFRNASLLILVAAYWGFLGMPAHIFVHGLSPVAGSIIPTEVNSFAMNLALGEFIGGLFNAFLASVLMGFFALLTRHRTRVGSNAPTMALSDYLFHVLAVAVTGPAILFILFSALPAQNALERHIETKMVSDTEFFKGQVDRWFESRFVEVERLALQLISSKNPSLFGPSLPAPSLPPNIRHLWLFGEDGKVFSRLEGPDTGPGPEHPEFLSLVKDALESKARGVVLAGFRIVSLDDRVLVWGSLESGHVTGAGMLAELNLEGLRVLMERLEKRAEVHISMLSLGGTPLVQSGPLGPGSDRPGLSMGAGHTSTQHVNPLLAQAGFPASELEVLARDYRSRFAMRFSYLSISVPVGSENPIKLMTRFEVGKQLEKLEKAFVLNIEILLALMFLSLCAVKFGAKRIAAPLTELMKRTTEMIRSANEVPSPHMTLSRFSEIRQLQLNFGELSEALSARFQENKRARSELEMRVFERTRMLQRSNDSLAAEIAERKLLAEDRDRIVGILQTAADFIGMASPDGRVIWLNDFARKSCGLSAYEDLSKMNLADFHPPWAVDRVVREAIPSAMRNGVWVGENAFLDKDGNVIPVSQMVIAHKDASGQTRYLSTIQRDMRVFKKVQQELEQAKSEAEVANRSKTLFLANMSHEVRTPVAVIRGFAELLSSGNSKPSERRDWLQAIVGSSRQLELLINDILDISKVESGKLQFEVGDIALPAFVSELKTIMDVNATSKGLALTFVCESFVPEVVRTDANRLRQILLNLIGNAIKFTEKGGITVRVGMFPVLLADKKKSGKQLSSDPFDRPPRLRFLVSDTGHGIAPENQGQLFQPFVQADPSISRRFGGTGLGLYLSRQLAHLLGGSLRLESSAVGEGSTFALEIDPGEVMDVPLVNTFEKVSRRARPAAHTETPTGGLNSDLTGRLVLVVEDAPELRLLFGQVLRKAGAGVDFAQDGKEGVVKAMAGSHDLILMDLQMPIMGGYEAMRELTLRGKRTPVVALTAHALVGEKERCLEAGFTEYLTKPVNLRLLIETVGRLSAAPQVQASQSKQDGIKKTSLKRQLSRTSKTSAPPEKKAVSLRPATPRAGASAAPKERLLASSKRKPAASSLSARRPDKAEET